MKSIKAILTITLLFMTLFCVQSQNTEESVDEKKMMQVYMKDDNLSIYDLSKVDSIRFEYEEPEIDYSLVSVSIESLQLAPLAESEFYVEIESSDYLDSDLYPFGVELLKNEALADNSITDAKVVYSLMPDDLGYKVKFTAGTQKEELICRIILGGYVKDIPITVDYGVYLSHNIINPNNPNDGIGLLTYKTIYLGETLTLNYSFFCYLDGASDEQKAAVKEILLNKENYVADGLTLEIGDVTIDDSDDVWVVSLPLTSTANVYEQGIIAITIEDKTLQLNLTCDDGKKFSELYISFNQINTYSEEVKLGSRELNNSYLKYVGGNVDESAEPERFKIIVWYTMSPDDRGDYINWNLSLPQGASAPVKYLGMQKINTQQFEFEFEVQAPGQANIGFTIENPKADDPSLSEEDKALYETYRIQTATALVNVIDRNTVEVESVVFVNDADPLVAEVITEQETTARSVPLYTYIAPEESVGPWPSVFSIECQDGAEATVKQSGIDETTGREITPEISITHAGTILVTATSRDKTAVLTVTAKLRINQTEQGDKLQLSTTKNEYLPGETDKVKAMLRSTYKVYDNEYTWTSSNPEVVEIDAEGNITAKGDGTSTITVSITDDYGYTLTATKDISVRSVSADANFNDPQWDGYYIIDLGEGGTYYMDTEEGSEDLFTIVLNTELSGEGVYTAGTDFRGTITFPSNDVFTINGGTITISGDEWTFDLQVSRSTASGKVVGTKTYILLEW